MSQSRTLWDTISAVAKEEGVELFDLDFPGDASRGGVVRVYITKPAGTVLKSEPIPTSDEESEGTPRNGVQFEDCVRVSKRLLDIDEQDAFIPETCSLEVSSPGVNRRLRLPQHFAGAVGERVRIKFRDAATSVHQVVHGKLCSASGDIVEVESEPKAEVVKISLREVKEARVDFKF
jgi:ribosome maturation factor RimP